MNNANEKRPIDPQNNAATLLPIGLLRQFQEVNKVLACFELTSPQSNARKLQFFRRMLFLEKEQLLLGINSISQNTKFNSVSLLDGSYTSQIQVGNSTSEIMTLAISDISLANLATGLDTISLTTASGAASAATIIETAIDTLAEQQSMLGAKQNRLQHNINYQANTVTQTEQARGRIIDTDYALETSELAKQQILSQAATSMLAHANQSSDYLLNLIAS